MKLVEFIKPKFKMPKLQSFDFSPAMSEETLRLHYHTLTKNYVKKANAGEGKFQEAGAFLHILWWEQLQKPTPVLEMNEEISNFFNDRFESVTIFQYKFKKAAITINGNGWCALTKNGSIKQILNHQIIDNIILVLDMWEHAYLLDYKADKEKYVDNFWNMIDWDVILKRF